MNVSMIEALELCDVSPPPREGLHIHCPFHLDATASLAVWEDHWHCFGCGKGGSPLAFIANWVADGEEPDRTHFSLAAKLVNRTFDMEDRPERVVTQRVLLDLTDRLAHERMEMHTSFIDAANEFLGRKWPHLSLRWLIDNFGVVPTRHALWIPHVDNEGVVRGIKTRSYATGNKLAVEGSCFTCRLYRTRPLLGMGDAVFAGKAILCEGESDTWTMTKLHEGCTVTVYGLPSGAKAWKDSFTEELRCHAGVDLWLDADKTGREAAASILERLLSAGIPTRDNVVPFDYSDVTAAVMDGWRP